MSVRRQSPSDQTRAPFSASDVNRASLHRAVAKQGVMVDRRDIILAALLVATLNPITALPACRCMLPRPFDRPPSLPPLMVALPKRNVCEVILTYWSCRAASCSAYGCWKGLCGGPCAMRQAPRNMSSGWRKCVNHCFVSAT